MNYAVQLWNMLPHDDTNLSPNEFFASAKQNDLMLQDAKVWGCPSYILDPALQDGKKIPHWQL